MHACMCWFEDINPRGTWCCNCFVVVYKKKGATVLRPHQIFATPFLYVRCIIFGTVTKAHNYRHVRTKLPLANLLVSGK